MLPLNLAKKINAKIGDNNTKNLVSYSGHKIKVVGEIDAPCQINDVKAVINCKIIDENQFPILGKDTCQEYKLLIKPDTSSSIYSINNEEEIFSGLGCIKNYCYDIDLVGNPKFDIVPPRKIPHAMQSEVKNELKKMIKMKVIESVTDPTPVVSPMVIVHKNNKLRICLDPYQLNGNILRRHFPLKTIDDIVSRLHNSKYLTLLDCKKGFWQIPVTERTKKYLTFSTPWGRYSFTRLPFGLSSSPEVFAQILTNLLDKFENVECSMDDILIHAETKLKLEQITKQVLNT